MESYYKNICSSLQSCKLTKPYYFYSQFILQKSFLILAVSESISAESRFYKYMKKLITLLFVICNLQLVICNLYAQPVIEEWVRRYPDTVNGWGSGNAITVDNKGYVYVTGTIIISNLMKYGTVKYSENGDVKWISIYEGTNTGGRQPAAIAVDESGNVYVTGYGYQTGNYFDFLTIKYDSLGNEKWVRFYDGGAHEIDQATGIKTDKAGNVYVSGYASLGGIHFVYCAIKYNPEGEELWVRQYGIPNSGTETFAMAIDDKSNIYITGSDSEKVATVSFDSSGNLRWSNRYPFVSIAYSIAVDKDYNTFICGIVGDTLIHGNDYLIIKYSQSGQQLWVRKYTYCHQGGCNNTAESVVVDRWGNVYVTGGVRNTPNGRGSLCTIKYSNNGDSIWLRKSYERTGSFYTTSTVDSFGGTYIASLKIDSVCNSLSYFTLKYDSSGTVEWEKIYCGCYTNSATAHGITLDNIGNAYITGFICEGEYPTRVNMTTIKYSQPLYGIKKISEKIPQNYKLYQNFPNPFNPVTKIKFDISSEVRGKKQEVRLAIYDVLGREIETLANELLNPGTYEVEWDGSKYSSGVYFCRLTTQLFSETKRIALIK